MLRFILSVALALVCSVASAQTPFPVRTVLAGQVVTVPKGDYLLTKQAVVKLGGKLILEAGVNIKVQIGLPIINYGELDIRGTSSEPVTIWPDALGICGTIAVYPTVGSPRPKLTATYLDLTHTLSSTSLLLSGADFSISNSRITNLSTASSRICVAVANGASGVLSSCFLDGCKDRLATPVVGVTVDSSSASVDLIETIIANSDLIRSGKQFTLVSGSIE